MRIAVALTALLAAACSTTPCENCGHPDGIAQFMVDTDDDGLPDTRGGGFGFTSYGVGIFADENDDGLPDARLVYVAPTRESALEVKLIELEQAIAAVRRELRHR